MNTVTMLVVDDSFGNRAIVRKIFESVHYNVMEASNGVEALDVLRYHSEIDVVVLDIVMPELDGYGVLSAMRANREWREIPVVITAAYDDEDAQIKAFDLGADDVIGKPYNSRTIRARVHNLVERRMDQRLAAESMVLRLRLEQQELALLLAETDELTGLYNRGAFLKKAAVAILEKEPGYYTLSCFDVDNFKVINDQYGTEMGDMFLKGIALNMKRFLSRCGGIGCRTSGDNFALIYPAGRITDDELLSCFYEEVAQNDVHITASISVGRYMIEDRTLSVSLMIDRALMAKRSIKGRYDVHIAYYDESMRMRALNEQWIISQMENSLRENRFEAWLQPQYNHANKAMIGAEILVRWHSEERGMIPPGEFIPIFERNGFVYQLDRHIWEQACKYLRKWLDAGKKPLPLSVNVSRYDIFRDDFYDAITSLVTKYDIPKNLFRIEITESAFAKSAEQIINMVNRLREFGLMIEIDDFGSGYSSFNTLKDVNADILKLDMRFLEGKNHSERGGNILESIVRMAKWLNMPVIAEGVETKIQADYLRSIGCSYVQGYLYARPMPVGDYEKLWESSVNEHRTALLETLEFLDNNAFWDPKSIETMIFNRYSGGACVFEYFNGRIEMLRVNEKYAATFDTDLSEDDILRIGPFSGLESDDRQKMVIAIERAFESGSAESFEVRYHSYYRADRYEFIRFTIRMIASNDDRYLFYAYVENMTAQRLAEQKLRETSDQLGAIMNNVNSGVAAIVMDNDENIKLIFTNEKYYSVFGYTREQFTAEVKNAFDIVSPEDNARIHSVIREALSTRAPTVYEYRCINRDGSIHFVRNNASITSIAGIGDRVLLTVITDITNEKETERKMLEATKQLRFLNDVSRDLLDEADTEKAIDGMLCKVREYFQGSRAYVFEFGVEGLTIQNTYEVCAPEVSIQIDNLQNIPSDTVSYWLDMFSKHNHMHVCDVGQLADDRDSEQKLLDVLGADSMVAVPLHRDGLMIGLMGVDNPSRNAAHVDHLEALGDYMSVMLTRRDLNAKLKNDNDTLRHLMNDMPGGFVRLQVHDGGRITPLFFNEGFCRMVGMAYGEAMGTYKDDVFAGVHPDDRQMVMDAVYGSLNDDDTYSIKYRLAYGSADSERYVWVMIFSRTKRDDFGATYLNVYYADVSSLEQLNNGH